LGLKVPLAIKKIPTRNKAQSYQEFRRYCKLSKGGRFCFRAATEKNGSFLQGKSDAAFKILVRTEKWLKKSNAENP